MNKSIILFLSALSLTACSHIMGDPKHGGDDKPEVPHAVKTKDLSEENFNKVRNILLEGLVVGKDTKVLISVITPNGLILYREEGEATVDNPGFHVVHQKEIKVKERFPITMHLKELFHIFRLQGSQDCYLIPDPWGYDDTWWPSPPCPLP